MKISTDRAYEKELKVLQDLFGEKYVNSCIDRLNTIHSYTETIWDNYIDKIPNKYVKYLLIAEAPPWSDTGPPQYFLDPISRSRSLMKAFRKAFFENIYEDNPESIIQRFAEKGLLLIDSLPFSMDYSGKRNNINYRKLVGLSVHSYMLKKLSNNELIFSKNMRIIFGYETNACVVIKTLGGEITLSNHIYSVNESMICTNKAHYPDANKIRAIICTV